MQHALAAEAEFARSSGIVGKLASAARRRLSLATHMIFGRGDAPNVAEAFDWLTDQVRDDGLPDVEGGSPSLSATARAVSVAVEYGQLQLAETLCQAILGQQMTGGAFEGESKLPSILNTCVVVRGLTQFARESHPQDATAAQAICSANAARDWLVGRVSQCGRLVTSASAAGSHDRYGPRNLALFCAAGLRANLGTSSTDGGDMRRHATWARAAEQLVSCFFREQDPLRWDGPLDVWLHGVEALGDLGQRELSLRALMHIKSAQQRGGQVPATSAGGWCSNAGMAHVARLWYRSGEPELQRAADRALVALRRSQLSRGAVPIDYGRSEAHASSGGSIPATIEFLRAAAEQVRSAFASTVCDFPAEIDARDGRWRAVRDWRSALQDGASLIDVGCGRGRYLRRLAAAFPQGPLTGVDVSPQFLRDLPRGVAAKSGTQLRIPAATGEFDGAMSIESLEHALLPRQAVSELCRVVRPGGGVLIIDKDRRRQALSRHQPWERWFTADEVHGWLAEHCDQVAVRSIEHGTAELTRSIRRSNLFLCWTARKRSPAVRRAA